LVLPDPGFTVKCDVVVRGIEGGLLDVDTRGSIVVDDIDAWRALFKALSAPSGFNELRVGIDPGSLCSIAAYADNILVWVEKLDCRLVARRVKWLVDVVNARRYTVNLGSGPGYERLAESILREGLELRIVPEEATTSRPILSKLEEEIDDEDILAAMTIALAH